jgi:hypothetical protein
MRKKADTLKVVRPMQSLPMLHLRMLHLPMLPLTTSDQRTLA